MAPHQHLAWFEENVEWFEARTADQLSLDVLSCPGWTVLDVLNHLSLGLGLAYPTALSKPPETAEEDAFDGVAWPSAMPGLPEALHVFAAHMRDCLDVFRRTDPSTPCWTYAGPGAAGFWFRRAAIETTLHRMDVEEAIGASSPLASDRAVDAVVEAIEFALPLAAAWSRQPSGALAVSIPELPRPVAVGQGEPTATLRGESEQVLRALWGRDGEDVLIAGDVEVGAAWLAVVEAGFAGR